MGKVLIILNCEFYNTCAIFQIVIYGAQNILTEDASPEGFLLLKIMRSYLELDMYASLTIHTETTLAAGREELQRYSDLIEVYSIGPYFEIIFINIIH